ncbi:MAG: N-glycosylase/DNA lyase [Candidatus Omnitrophica bacterium]|nr:N-glycosylase/DNA lyase [Candidatus Omnitrophota bacterium]
MNRLDKELILEYKSRKKEIKDRLAEFRSITKTADRKELFSELCFCIMTANANALHCDTALKELKAKELITEGPSRALRPHLRGRVRFHNKKADYIVAARRLLCDDPKLNLNLNLNLRNVIATRDWLVENVKGLGFKEASHFLRNIGLGRNIAILDRHILKNLKKHGVIKTVPDSVGSRKVYIGIEDKMREFSKNIGIPMDELDLLFWSVQTGFIFK